MKQINFTITFEEEKMNALKMYMKKKDDKLTPEQEMGEALQKLYEKYVPVQVREYIDENSSTIALAPKQKRTAKTNAVKPHEEVGEQQYE